MRRAAIAALALAGAAIAPAKARPARGGFEFDPARIDRQLEAFVGQGRVAGAEVLVWKDGHEKFYASAGMANRETARPFTRDTQVQAFSMTKPITGVALMQLWEQGKFGLDDPLSRYLPQFAAVKVYDGTNPDGSIRLRPPSRPITVRDVMRHIAGLTYGDARDAAAYGEAGEAVTAAWNRLQPLSPDHTLAQYAEILPQVPLLWDPGTHWHYSTGVDVQARLVEVLSGQPFDQYVAEHVFKPLGMAHSCWKCSADLLPRLAMIYTPGKDGKLEPIARDAWLVHNFMGKPMTEGGAGLVTTVNDYMRFARMLLGEGELDGVRILRPATVRLMATEELDPRITERQWLGSKGSGGFGLDVFVRTAPPKDAAENRGAVGEFFWDGYPSMLFWVDPANRMAVVFATQKVPFDGTLHHDIRQAIYGADYAGR
jgi:CubicO group peptidase (beta-lactamase class C family)